MMVGERSNPSVNVWANKEKIVELSSYVPLLKVPYLWACYYAAKRDPGVIVANQIINIIDDKNYENDNISTSPNDNIESISITSVDSDTLSTTSSTADASPNPDDSSTADVSSTDNAPATDDVSTITSVSRIAGVSTIIDAPDTSDAPAMSDTPAMSEASATSEAPTTSGAPAKSDLTSIQTTLTSSSKDKLCNLESFILKPHRLLLNVQKAEGEKEVRKNQLVLFKHMFSFRNRAHYMNKGKNK